MSEKLKKQLAIIQTRIEQNEEKLKKELLAVSRNVSKYAGLAKDGQRLKEASGYVIDFAKGGIEKIAAINEELDKLYAEKYILEYIQKE